MIYQQIESNIKKQIKIPYPPLDNHQETKTNISHSEDQHTHTHTPLHTYKPKTLKKHKAPKDKEQPIQVASLG